MTRVDYAFTDSVTGAGVWYYRDKFGRNWLAENAWSRFRMEREELPPHIPFWYIKDW